MKRMNFERWRAPWLWRQEQYRYLNPSGDCLLSETQLSEFVFLFGRAKTHFLLSPSEFIHKQRKLFQDLKEKDFTKLNLYQVKPPDPMAVLRSEGSMLQTPPWFGLALIILIIN